MKFVSEQKTAAQALETVTLTNTGSIVVVSDQRLKTDIKPQKITKKRFDGFMDNVGLYEFTKGGERQLGVIAQEIFQQKEFHLINAHCHDKGDIQLVEGCSNYCDPEELTGEEILMLDQQQLVFMLLGCIKRLHN